MHACLPRVGSYSSWHQRCIRGPFVGGGVLNGLWQTCARAECFKFAATLSYRKLAFSKRRVGVQVQPRIRDSGCSCFPVPCASQSCVVAQCSHPPGEDGELFWIVFSPHAVWEGRSPKMSSASSIRLFLYSEKASSPTKMSRTT